MKARYTKPLLEVEVFSLAQSIARDCGETSIPKDQLTFGEPGKCVWDLGGGFTVFTGTHCTIDGSTMGFECYNNPTDEFRVFRS